MFESKKENNNNNHKKTSRVRDGISGCQIAQVEVQLLIVIRGWFFYAIAEKNKLKKHQQLQQQKKLDEK